MPSPPTFADVLAARDRIAPHAHRTPVVTCRSLDEIAGAQVYFKCEHLQRVGAFKFRGACNTVMSLSDEDAARGVVTHSSGNHGAALALAARIRGIPAHVVVPSNASPVKLAALATYGAIVTLCEPTLVARETTAASVLEETGGTFVHPYDDPRVIAGQGTAALELFEDTPDLDLVVAPVGGGGLLSGTCIATHAMRPQARIVAGEPAGADDAYRSLERGEIVPSVAPRTCADGLRTSLGTLTFPVIREHVTAVVRVSEDDIVAAMRLLWERAKLLVETSSAVALAAVLADPRTFAGRRVGIILTGGNVDLDALPWTR